MGAKAIKELRKLLQLLATEKPLRFSILPALAVSIPLGAAALLVVAIALLLREA